MTDSQAHKNVRWRNRLVLIMAFLAIVMVCAHAGMEQPLPFSAFSFDKPYIASRNEQGMIVADKNGDRLLFLDENEQLVRNTQAPVLTSLLAFGTETCCLFLGVFFAISGVTYYFITRKRGDFA